LRDPGREEVQVGVKGAHREQVRDAPAAPEPLGAEIDVSPALVVVEELQSDLNRIAPLPPVIGVSGLCAFQGT
jgi:hypothetical protein